MDEHNYSRILCEKINELRKTHNLTQEALADKLGITFQAVSKWENGLSCPDITLLPQIAEIFDVSMDELFGREAKPKSSADRSRNVPWPDDDTIHVVVYKGKKILDDLDPLSNLTFKYDGPALNVESSCSITCDGIEGNAKAGGDLNCSHIKGNVTAGCDINCSNIDGDARAGCDIKCDHIEGNAKAGCDIHCNTIKGK